jgi:Protein of unknown function (DUF3667)
MPEEKKVVRHCPNCGEIVDNRFCPACGQENREFKATFKEMIKEFTSHALNLDSRFFRTLKYLLFYPGWLTIEYFKGRREFYISPLKLYLIISMIYFLTFTVSSFYTDISRGINLIEEGIETTNSDSLDAILEDTAQNISEEPKDDTITLFNNDTQIDTDKFKMSFINNAPRIMFFLLPLAALILKLLYRRRILYFQHLIFLLHVHSYFFFTMILYRILDFEIVYLILLLLSAVYLYVAQKKFYRQSIRKTILKLVLFSTFYFIILGALLLANMMITVLSMI